MSETFECPKCGASYARERRRLGKAVVCACGHRFLVPPMDEPPPSQSPSPGATRPDTAPAHRTPRRTPPARPAAASDASAEVLPYAETVQPAPQQGVRWAEPVEPEPAAPLMEAEVLYSDNQHAGLIEPVDDLFGAAPPYSAAADGSYGPPPMSLPPPSRSMKKAKRRSVPGGGPTVHYTNYVAYFVFFFILPVAGVLTLIGLTRPRQGAPITLWNAKRSAAGEFSVEYQLDRAQLDPAGQYYWVINEPQGKIEFPIPANVWKHRDKLSGRSTISAPGQFGGPYTTFIEEQLGQSRTRVSNAVPVVIGP